MVAMVNAQPHQKIAGSAFPTQFIDSLTFHQLTLFGQTEETVTTHATVPARLSCVLWPGSTYNPAVSDAAESYWRRIVLLLRIATAA
jgi:hypothetical protein